MWNVLKRFTLVFGLGSVLVWQQALASPQSSKVIEFTSQIAQLNTCVDFSVTSWIRSPSRNKAVGGAENSLHMQGLAVDIVLDNKEDSAFFLRKVESMGLEALDEGDHIHVSVRDSNNVRLRRPWGSDEIMGDEAGEREPETSAIPASYTRTTGRESRNKSSEGQRIHMDTPSDCSVGSIRCVDLTKDSSYSIRYFGSLRVDRDQSGVLVFHRGSGDSEVAYDSSQHDSPDTPRHPYSIGDNWAILRR